MYNVYKFLLRSLKQLATHMLGCTEVSLIMHLYFFDCLLSFSFIVWVRMTLPMCLSFDAELEIAPYIIRTSLFSPQQNEPAII